MATISDMPASRPLTNVIIGISISEAESSGLCALGLTSADVNDVTVELCRRLVSLGARIVLGHQWRPGGVMEAIARFAQVYQPESNAPIIDNYLAYPDHAALSPHDRKKLSTIVVIHDGEDREQLPRPIALSQMRELMAKRVTARIALCGKITQPEGFVPGVIEETALALRQRQPVYVSRMMGGTADLLARYIRGDRHVFANLADSFDPDDVAWINSSKFKTLMRAFDTCDIPSFCEQCGLTRTELDELFDAPNLDTVLHLTTRGLTRRRNH